MTKAPTTIEEAPAAAGWREDVDTLETRFMLAWAEVEDAEQRKTLAAQFTEALSRLAGRLSEADKLRQLFEHVADTIWDHETDIEWADWHDKAEDLGLLVGVPATQEFIDQWDADTMWTWAWSEAALTPHPSRDGEEGK